MGITAGFLAQNVLKFLLNFGCVQPFLGYNALSDFFPTYNMAPNPECSNSHCVKRQAECKAQVAAWGGRKLIWRNNDLREDVPEAETEAVVDTSEYEEWGFE